MKNTLPPNTTLNVIGKGSNYINQLKRVNQAFFDKPKTMKEVDLEIGIMRESICRYCATLRKAGRLFPVLKRQCNVTKYPKVTAWTTNPELVPPSTQLNLF